MKDISEEFQTLMNRKNLVEKYKSILNEVTRDPDVINFISDHRQNLDKDVLTKSASKLYEYCEEKKKIARHEPSQVPGYMPVLIISNHLIDIAYQPTKELIEEQNAVQLKRRVKSINMPKIIRDASFKSFIREDSRNAALLSAIQFTNHYIEKPRDFHKGIYIYGALGIGKTYLLGAMANRLAHNGFQTTMIHFPSFAAEMKESISNSTFGEKTNAIKRAPILMIDDIGADSSSTWIRDDVLGVILEYRMQEELPTCFTSNFSMEELQKGYLTISVRGDEEPIKAQRIIERIKFLSEEVQMTGENRRNPDA
ncbi:primosomal protein DnaI [Lactiplantibacillus plantarum]|uniref:primosomal protein DnaI n=1 Tax=Lactiplantibacillus plantarum TaxID=1590 RepID=UPI0009413241|nr:primosomal protein DnaI [Lactiplantibacillus plantarum]MBC6382255.1 primosomal protein DnaI [Lactiplantibacillus plantarum]